MRPLPTLFATLLLSTTAHALPIGGGGGTGDPTPPPISCVNKVTGHLSASPTAVDPGGSTTLSWSVTAPANCTAFHGVHVANRAVALSGSLVVQPSATTRYYLSEIISNGELTLDSVEVTVGGVPMYVSVSSGRSVTANDLSQFDARWTSPTQHAAALGGAAYFLKIRFDGAAWGTGEHMSALARMYDLTRDRKYLAQLREFIEQVLLYREDHHPDGSLVDGYRGRVMPAWGGIGINQANMFKADEVVSSVLAYPIAAFARIVAEDPDPTVQADYGADAVRYANAVAETAWAFMPQMHYRPSGAYFEAWLQQLDVYSTMPTDQQCQTAYQHTLDNDPGADAATIKHYNQELSNCKNLHKVAGLPMSHNENLAFQMVLMELYRALDSTLYKTSPARSTQGEPLRVLTPVLVARQQRYFMGHVELVGDRYRWHHADELPSTVSHDYEDTSHGALDMRYHEILRRDFARLNAASSALGEPIPLDPVADPARFAATFLEKVATGANFNFAEGVDGGVGDPPDHRNPECDGWVSLSVADDTIWHVCQEMSLRIVGSSQPYLNMGNHSALLWNKRYLPLPVRPPPRDRAPVGSVLQ
jgi:hypothetical protein